jgi:hypothetical protein
MKKVSIVIPTSHQAAHLPRILYSIRFHGRDRKVGQHSSERYQRLLDESCRCAERARAFLAEQGGDGA